MKNRRHILVIEDNSGDAYLIRKAFKENSEKPALHIIPNGEEALKFLYQKGDYREASRPDFIILDLNLPKQNGWDLLRIMKSDPLLKIIPIIVFSTSSDQSDINTVYNLHANCYIKKPIDLDQYFHIIQSIHSFWMNIVILPNEESNDQP